MVIVEKARKRIVRQEIRKRALFTLKLLLLIGLLYVNFQYKTWIEEEQNFLSGIVRALLFYLLSNLLISLGRIVVVHLYIQQKQLKNEENNVILAINQIATLLNVAVLIATVFLLLDLSWQTFFTSFSLVAVATVILTKEYIANTVNGLIIMVSDRILLNDYVKIGNHTGKVVDITLSNVHLLDDAEHVVLIPNNTVFASDIINYTKKASGYVEVNFDIKPEVAKDLAQLEEQLIEAMQPHDHLIRKNSYELRVKNILMDKISLQFRFALQTPHVEKEKELQYRVLRKIPGLVITG